ncbi:MAG TPA: anthranilate phosphoribosyltransferase [Persephonella sp.]|uniref:Anthranilate phosphoribosyltransferase n=1 Tax=Persephonella marina (strain DSM 14350 / EX-H1) TaxID=123214 RepID=TRPD_PERMH|nr:MULTISPECIES: anthranilate phosphoribosyltransferase [Persephonella]C0QR68.1 RecName: Full=Anthranilate phosphoribosyltransferase [Persephonella marina EX-H1]ACO04266.1 anthranilate phosphoribosyltransferase [Persephonella marina EX-H1]HCB68911.1 anthranilate phosphoribosyltransferase [Persephonella sp.]
MIKEYIRKITEGKDLSADEMKDLFNILMEGQATDAQIGAVLIGLKMKGESVEEISSAAQIMREKAVKVPVKDRSRLIDTCGTGGDKVDTFNVSTITAFVIAGAGVKVAKHGNRSVSSKCGSADIMEALGVKIDLSPEQAAEAIDRIGLGFLFAPVYHPAMKNVIRQRREIGVRTIFNILGPLSNPAGAKYQLLGVYDKDLVEPVARVLSLLGIERAYVVHGMEGLDEVSITTDTMVAEVDGGDISVYSVKPEDFGIERASLDDIRGGDLDFNLQIALDILEGKDRSRKTDFVSLNAGFAFHAVGVVDSVKEGIELAKETIYSKKAYEILEKLREYSKGG